MKTHTWFPFPACVGLAAALILSSRALAQITVTTVADENDSPAGAQVSLREALRDSPNGGQITFDAALHGKVLVLTFGEVAVAGKTLTVSAPSGLVIEARGLSRIFNVAVGAGLNLTGLTLQGGLAPGDGGAILNAGTLGLTDCVLRDNRAADGANGTNGSPGRGYDHPNGFLAAGDGGPGGAGSHGGAVSSTGSLSVLRCHFIGNAAGSGGWGGWGGFTTMSFPIAYGGKGGPGGTGGNGGAIMNSGSLELTGCVFESNSAGIGGNGGRSGSPEGGVGSSGGRSGDGGAVHHAGDMIVERCTFVGNQCPPGARPYLNALAGGFGGYSGNGAAVFCSSGTASLTNSTLTGNRNGESGKDTGLQFGGAIAAGSGSQLHLVHCTVAGNLAPRFYPYIQNAPWYASPVAGIFSRGPVQCENCILSGNLVNRTGTAETPIWEENNFDGSLTVIPSGPLDGRTGTNAQLAALALTSGQLPVLVPGATSPAVDAGVALTSPPATDQRGQPRPIGAPDLGAVELQWVETAPRARQSISFSPRATSETRTITLSAFATSELPVSFELVSGPAILSGNTLTPTALGFVAVKAIQTGDPTTASALPVIRVIEVLQIPSIEQTIPFAPAQSYTVDPPSRTVITLPATTSAGLGIEWWFVNPPPAWITLSGLQVGATNAGSVQICGKNAGNGEYLPVSFTWTLTFVNVAVLWWETPPSPGGSGPHVYTLVEGSPHGLNMTARISSAHTSSLPVPSLPGGLIATPSIISAGQTSVQCHVTLPANPLLTNHSETLTTGNPAQIFSTFVLANRVNVPLNVTAPARAFGGTSFQVDAACPGVQTPASLGPPPDLGVRNFTVTAFDFDNPATVIPVKLDSTSSNNALYPTRYLRITFPPVNLRARLVVTTDDGITGQSGPIQILADTNADGDGINDLVEAALQRPANQLHEPPLAFERDGTAFRVVLASRPLDLKGWTVVIEWSTDLQTWTPAPGGSTTVTPNPDGTTERVSVLLPTDAVRHFVRLRVGAP